MKHHYFIAPAHFSLCIVGVCKLSNGPNEVVISWLSRPEVVKVMLVVYLALIVVDIIGVVRWVLARVK